MKPVSIILLLCHMLLLIQPNLIAASAQKEMEISSLLKDSIVGSKGEQDGIVLNSIYAITRHTADGDISIGKARVRIVQDNKCGLKIIEQDSSYVLTKNDKLVEIPPEDSLHTDTEYIKKQTDDMSMDIDNAILTPEQEQEYNNQKLSISIPRMNAAQFKYFYDNHKLTKWKIWQAYQGTTKLDEPGFFGITGRDREAMLAKGYYQIHKTQLITGTIMTISGLIMIKIAQNHNTETKHNDYIYQNNEGDKMMTIIGCSVGVIGVVLATFGLSSHNKNWASFVTVDQIANEYNRTLKLEILKKW